MFPINLFLLSKTKPLSNDEFNDYLNCITNSKRQIKVKEYERENLYQLVDLMHSKCNIAYMSGFYYSYTIDQISKEFDLIKILNDYVLNIEIKSEFTSTEKIEKQLIQNSYYLKNVRGKVYSFTFVAKDNEFYKLNEQLKLEKTNLNEFISIINLTNNYFENDLDKIIKPACYLVSPFNNVDKFLNNEYFLTNQQQQIKNDIINDIYNRKQFTYFKILGDAGTGKTLLVYDIAKKLSKDFKICVVHSGILNSGHFELNKKMKNCDIISAKEFNYCKLNNYDLFIIDESQRLYISEFQMLIDFVKEHNVKAIFSIGTDQLIQKSENRNDIDGKINKLSQLKQFHLSNKIRTNYNLASFIKNVVNLAEVKRDANYEHIKIYYVSTKNEASELVKYLETINYQYISFTPSLFKRHEIDEFVSKNNTHVVIGQEFDNVVMIMGQNFKYIDGRLHSPEHPNPDYIFSKLFYQGITRARINLAIIVHRNPELYTQLIKIKRNKGE